MMFKKMLAGILLGIFLVQVLGFTFYFNFERAKIKKQLKTFIKEGVPEDQLKVFEFSTKEFKNLNFTKKKEFKLNGRFYDIVWKSKLKNGKLFLKCVDDKQETELFKNLAFLVDDNISKQTNSPLKTVFSIVIKPMLVNTTVCELKIIQITEFHKDIFYYLKKQSIHNPTHFSPPPDFIV